MKKMTDLQRFRRTYNSVGMLYAVVEDRESGNTIMYIGDHYYETGVFSRTDKLEGYSGFHTRIIFNSEGSFLRQGFWE